MMKLDHIALIVSSEESLGFYKLLGFSEFKRIVRSNDVVVFMRCDQIVLEVFVDPKHQKKENNNEPCGLRHVCFSVDDLDKYNLPGCGEVKTDWFGRRFLFCQDPDGQIIELNEREKD